MEKKLMDDILSKVEELKNMIISSDEYKEYEKNKNLLDNNKEIKKIISQIKEKQKIIINKENSKKDKEKEEFEVSNLFRKLHSFTEYNNYITSAKKLNEIITKIQKRFEEYFNNFVI